jgi:thioredoxin-related protein
MNKLFLLVFIFIFVSLGYAQNENKSDKPKAKIFDETRDPKQDLADAVEIAKKENKIILMDVGGNWCIWCLRLDKIFKETEEIAELLAKHYVFLKVNYSRGNKNEEFLSQYPKIEGYPHFFILDSNGELLLSFNTGDLEEDDGYDTSKIVGFLQDWAERKE